MKVVFSAFEKGPNMKGYLYILDEQGIKYEYIDPALDGEALLAALKGADVVVTSIKNFDAALIEQLDASVKCLIRPAIGYEIIDVDAATKRGILVCNVPDYSTEEVAVHAVGLMLAAMKKVVFYDKRLRGGAWKQMGYLEGWPVRRFSTQTVGLMGFGSIAKNVARYLANFGAKLIAYDPYVPEEAFQALGVAKMETADELFAAADIISLHIPLFESTRKIVDKDGIAKMKDGVIIVNTARGPLIDEAALIEGLKSGKIRAAGLDVFETEPFNDLRNELFTFENVVLTPHIAYQTTESFEDLQRKCVEIAAVAAKGEVPYSAVNKKALGRT